MARIDKGFFEQHVQRVRALADPERKAVGVADYMVKNTMIRGKPFSFKGFRYQRFILDHPAKIKNTRKSAQCGVSEMQLREATALCLIHNGVNCIYVLPTGAFASTFSGSRLAPIIEGSPTIENAIHPGNDSASVKRFRNDSFIFMKGGSNIRQTISVPCDILVIDERDFFEDDDVLTSFQTRVTPRGLKIQRQFSTPTVAGFGISYEFEHSIRHMPLNRCNHCNHWFEADYFLHVKLPGWRRDIGDINYFSRQEMTAYDLDSAYLECPKCGRAVDVFSEDCWDYVIENPDSNYDAAGFQVTPFIVGNAVPPGDIIRSAMRFTSRRKFITDTLGLPAEDSTTGLSKEECGKLFTNDVRYPDSPSYQIAGVDLGGACAYLGAFPAADGHLRVMRAEMIPLNQMKKRIPEIFAADRVITSVFDALPYTDLVLELQAKIPSLWAAIFTQAKDLELYKIKEQEEDEAKATFGLRQLNVKKHQGMDFVVSMIREGQISFAPSTFDLRERLISHLTDMKRLERNLKNGEIGAVWQKSPQGEDHFFHALLYLVLANCLKGLAGGLAPLPMIAGKIKTKVDV